MSISPSPRLFRNRRAARRNLALRLESLEPRLVLSTVHWIGTGPDYSWENGANWDSGHAPTAGEDVVIDLGTNDFTVSINGGTNEIASLTTRADMYVQGELILDGDSSFEGDLFVNAATLRGTGNITLSGTTFLQSSDIDGPESSTITNKGTLTVRSENRLVHRDLINDTGAQLNMGENYFGLLYTGGNVDITNKGTFTFASGNFSSYIQPFGLEPLPTFDNQYIINTGTNANAGIYAHFTNSGRIDLTSGLLELGRRGYSHASSGAIHAGPGTILNILGDFDITAAIDADTVQFVGGTTNVNADFNAAHTNIYTCTISFAGDHSTPGILLADSSTVDFSPTGGPSTQTLHSAFLNASTLTGSDDFVLTGETILQNSDIDGPESSTITNEGTFNVRSSNRLLHRDLINDTGAQLNMGENYFGLLYTGGNVDITNKGTFTFASGNFSSYIQPFGLEPLPTFDNQYIINTGTNANAGIFAHFNNSGRIDLTSGLLELGRRGYSHASSGAIHAEPGTILNILGDFDITAPIDADTVQFVGGTTKLNADFNAAHTNIYTCTISFAGDNSTPGILLADSSTVDFSHAGSVPVAVTLQGIILSGTTLMGTDDLTVSGPFQWQSSTLQGVDGKGSLTVLSDMTIDRVNYVRDYSLINAGYATWIAGGLYFHGESSFVNLADATFEDKIDGFFGSDDNICSEFHNEGLFIKSGGSGVTSLKMDLYNSGIVRIDQGILDLSCGYVRVTGGGSGGGDGGQISGPFIGDVEIKNTHDLVVHTDPTPPPPVSNYVQTVTGNLTEVIGGLIAGTEYGQIVVTGGVTLNGTLRVKLINGFTPHSGDTFTVIDNQGPNPINGNFIGLSEGGIISAGTYSFRVSYKGGTGNDLVLTAVQSRPTLTVDSVVATYDAAAHPASFHISTEDGTDLSGLVVVTYTDAFGTTTTDAPINAGTYAAHASYPGDSRYLPVSANGTVVIAKATLTVTAQNASRDYGGADPVFTAEITGFAPGDSAATSITGLPALFGTAGTYSPVGSYLVAAFNGTLASSNYEFTFVNGILDVQPRAVTYSIGNASHVYGTTTSFASLPTSFPTGVNGETLSIGYDSVGNTTTSFVGTYPIIGVVSSGTGQAGSYLVTLLPGALSVTPATTAISATTSSSISVPGQYVTLTATVTATTGGAPGGSVTFRDGTTVLAVVPITGGSASAQVAFTSLGNHAITLSYLPDVNHTGSSPAGYTHSVKASAIVYDLRTRSYFLNVGGTSIDDQIQVQVQSNARNYQIQIQSTGPGSSTSVYAIQTIAPNPIARVVVYGLAGNDNIQVNTTSNVVTEIFAGTGDDTIQAGTGTNILVGGDGADTIQASGPGLLIGGRGADDLSAANGNSALVGGWTTYDEPTPANLDALDTIIASLASGGANLGSLLSSSTVRDDVEIDVLSGNTNGIDWFFANITRDVIKKKKSTDRTVNINGW